MLRRALTAWALLGVTVFGGCASAGPKDAAGGGAAGAETAGGSTSFGGNVADGSRPSGGGSATTGGTDLNRAGESSSAGSQTNAGRAGQGSGGAAGTSSGGGATSAGAGGGGGGGAGGPPVSTAKCPDTTWKLLWGDDFDGAAGTAVDGGKWAYDSGPNWYNGELQDYTTGNANASLDGNGNLVIEARAEAREGKQYTSARLKTEGKKTFTYGRFESRMKLPFGQGMWPAFWMLGGNSWPNTGEIDVMENLGREPSIAHGTIHGPGYSGAAGPTAFYTLPGGAKLSDDFHVFAVEWEASAIRWYVDGSLYSTKTPSDIKGNTWVFDHPFFIILNLAVGGDWPGAPDGTTVFPQQMRIDYVHVCQK